MDSGGQSVLAHEGSIVETDVWDDVEKRLPPGSARGEYGLMTQDLIFRGIQKFALAADDRRGSRAISLGSSFSRSFRAHITRILYLVCSNQCLSQQVANP